MLFRKKHCKIREYKWIVILDTRIKLCEYAVFVYKAGTGGSRRS